MSHMAPEVKQTMGISVEDFLTRSGMRIENRLQRLTDIHLRGQTSESPNSKPNSDIKYISLFTAVSLFVLLLAVVNFVNLATARSSGRAKEVGHPQGPGLVPEGPRQDSSCSSPWSSA